MSVQDVLDHFVAISQKIIGHRLTGVYLHGSMAMGCFHADKSDIDLIVIIEDDLTNQQKISLMEEIIRLNRMAPAKGLELSFVKKEYCKPFVYPTPFELHFSPAHLQWFLDRPEDYVQKMKGEDKDLAAHFTIINRYGVQLYGEAIADVFGEVPRKDYIDSIWYDIHNAAQEISDHPMSVILNLCRALAYVRDDLVLSKARGGAWALTHVDKQYHPLILQAQYSYTSHHVMQMDEMQAKQFAADMLKNIRREIEKR